MMNTISKINTVTVTDYYKNEFWNAMKRTRDVPKVVQDGISPNTRAYYLPAESEDAFRRECAKNGSIRALAGRLKNYDGGAVVWAYDSDDYAAVVPEGGAIPGFDAEDDFTKFRVGTFRIAALIKVSRDLLYDGAFDVENYVTRKMAKAVSRTEERLFLYGNGTTDPTGLLHETKGAETGYEGELSIDGLIELFFSVKPEYRKNAVWLMNDRTALALRKMKDEDGFYLWNQANDTILGKPVVISSEMPDAGEGSKPVLFGDFGYYKIVDRSPFSMKPLDELFIQSGRTGYVGFEFIDAVLIRRDAVKALAIGAENG